ncbi:CAP domain-containing protein [Dyadobacter sp. NIV53]|uniref:CAP domain-containing protein n=1 Tax=Dyadobacter sp. NIV53 TaxID=2861765 RepID=UPI001C885952|nr:CAP domain-containing protein [Dyadobacter sp. NIV53]
MKRAILSLVVFCFLASISIAQDIVRIRNVEKGSYLNIESGTVQSTEIKPGWLSARWELIKVQEGQFKIRNSWKKTFLNIEEGTLQCSEIRDGWLSARWGIRNIDGTNSFIIYNIWKPTLLINIETGSLACSEIGEDRLSARWNREDVGAKPVGNDRPVSDTGNNNSLNIQEVLAAHNALRIEVGVPPLVWSSELAGKAQGWANVVAKKNMGNSWVLEHSGPAENIAGGIVNGDSPAERVRLGWGEGEKVNFDRNTRKCIPGKVCSHYTQIVWRTTTEVGCAVTTNTNGKYILVCNYNPAGNFKGEPAY